jgi:hypothetical protein
LRDVRIGGMVAWERLDRNCSVRAEMMIAHVSLERKTSWERERERERERESASEAAGG